MIAMLGASIGGGLVNLVILGLFLLSFAFWIWMLIDCLRFETGEGSEKIIWVLVIVFTHFLGALLYFFIRRPTRRVALGR